jgi:hypothetical protein
MHNSLATAVLLYGALTFRALLRVGLDPVGGLAIVLAFLQPQLGNPTQNGPMVRVDMAAKAKGVPVRTGYSRHNGLQRRLGRCNTA